MASVTFKKVRVKYNVSGGTAVLKSSGAQGLAMQKANQMAARCNSLASGTLHKAKNRPEYVAHAWNGNYTSGAVVKANNVEGWVANRKHNILKKGCGV